MEKRNYDLERIKEESRRSSSRVQVVSASEYTNDLTEEEFKEVVHSDIPKSPMFEFLK